MITIFLLKLLYTKYDIYLQNVLNINSLEKKIIIMFHPIYITTFITITKLNI